MNKLFSTLRCAYLLWKMGFYFSDTTDTYSWDNGKTVRTDGFIRLNFDNGIKREYALADFDFLISNNEVIFVNLKSDSDQRTKSTFRYDIAKRK